MAVFNLIDEVKNLEAALTCEVCNHLLNDPLLVAKCGHSICRECFMQNFNMQCPICQVPINSKDSLEDKLLKELLAQLKKLKHILDNDSCDGKTITVDPKPIILNPKPVVSGLKESDNEYSAKTTNESGMKAIEKEVEKSKEENLCPAPKFASSTPKVRRKKKILPRSRSSRLSSSDDSIVQGTPGSSGKSKLIANSSKKRALQACKSEEKKGKSSLSPNASILSSTGNLNKKNHKGETLLHRSVIKNELLKVKELIAEGASVNTQDYNGWTPLHEASNRGFVEMAKLLLDNGALVNVPSLKDNITPLHDALINDQIEMAILLASRGADMHAKTALGYTAFDLCKKDEDKTALIESCSPFICANISTPNKKADIGDNNKIIMLHTNLYDNQKEHLQKCAQMLKAEVVDDFSQEVTHIITSCDKDGNCTRTMKILMGILTGKWIMNFQWIEVCLEYKHKIDEEVFEVQGTKHHPNTQGPKLARKNTDQKFPPLLDGFYFYLHGPFHKPTPEREDLCNLIHLGGGKILSREPREDTIASENYRLPYHASGTPAEGVSHVILYQDKPPRGHQYHSGHICTTHIMWLIECISEFKLKKFKNDTQSDK